jgi:hypothetical protein
MLPDFPEVRKFAQEILTKRFQKQVFQRSGIMQDIPKEVLYEGDRVELHRYDGSVQVVSMEPTKSELRLEENEFRKKGLGAVIEAMDKTAADMAEEQTKSFFRQLDEICKESGQTYDAKGQSLSYDLVLTALETTDIDFDAKGEPILPTLVTGSQMYEKIKNLEITKEQKERFEEIIERKRNDWRERESNRKLVN